MANIMQVTGNEPFCARKLTEVDTSTVTIFYHMGCMDGFFALYFYNKIHQLSRDKTTYVPMKPGTDAKLPEQGKLVFLDIAPTPSMMEKIIGAGASVFPFLTIIDHHESNLEICNYIPVLADAGILNSISIDVRQSVTLQTAEQWEDIPPHLLKIARYVDDRDRWQWALPDSKEISDYLFENVILPYEGKDVPRAFECVDKLKLPSSDELERAKIQHAYIEKLIADECLRARFGTLNMPDGKTKYQIAYINVRLLRSEICDKLLESFPKIDIAASWYYDHKENNIWFSMRSRQKGGINVSTVAQLLDINGTGGGHPPAAGCTYESPLGRYITPGDNKVADVISSYKEQIVAKAIAFMKIERLVIPPSTTTYKIIQYQASLFAREIEDMIIEKNINDIDFVIRLCCEEDEQLIEIITVAQFGDALGIARNINSAASGNRLRARCHCPLPLSHYIR
jgi:uncharacterized protein